jgi:hypothetical protein
MCFPIVLHENFVSLKKVVNQYQTANHKIKKEHISFAKLTVKHLAD